MVTAGTCVTRFNIITHSVYLHALFWFSEQSRFISLYTALAAKIKENNLYVCYRVFGAQQMAGA